MSSEIIVRDCNGNQLQDGDSVIITKDLKVKGDSKGLKRGAILKNIRLNEDDPTHIQCKDTFVKVEFVKKA